MTGYPAASAGDRDRVNVIFYEIPNTISGTIYFAIRDPGNDGTHPDYSGTGGHFRVDYYLYGGSGAYSDTTSRLQDYSGSQSSAIAAGTELDSYTADTETDSSDNGWVYFTGVSPSEGEKIGNKYYFKIAIIGQAENVYQNAFQLDVSYSDSGSPSGIASARAFAFNLTFGMTHQSGDSSTIGDWSFYPFVPDEATDSLTASNYSLGGSFSPAPTAEMYTYDDTSAGSVTVSDFPSGSASTDFSIGTETNRTWKLVISEADTSNEEYPADVWFNNSNSGEAYRIYSAKYKPPAADHVSVDEADGAAVSDGSDTERIVFQIVDSSGDPVPYEKNLYISLSGSMGGSPEIADASDTDQNLPASTAVITTTSDGMGWIDITDATEETVSVTVFTDGSSTDGNRTASSLSGTNESGSVVFAAKTLPSMISAGNTTLDVGTASAGPLANIVITENEADAITTTNGLRIKLPSALSDTYFDTTATPTLDTSGNSSGAVGSVSFEGGAGTENVMVIAVTTAFTAGDSVTISGVQLDTGTVSGNGKLLLSIDGGTDYLVRDSKVVTVMDTSSNTWLGSSGTNWSTDGNWSLGTAPTAGQNVTIKNVSNEPVLDANTANLADLIIEEGASLDLSGNDLTADSVTNDGTILLQGDEGVTINGNTYDAIADFDPASGSVEYYGSGSYSSLAFGNTYYDLTISGGGNYALGAALTVENGLTVSSGTLDASGGAYDLLLEGDVDFSGGAFSKGTGTFTLQAADAQSLDPNAQDLGAFLVTGSGTAVTPSGDLTVDSLTIDSGASLTIGTGISVDVGSGALTNAGTLISSGAITAGDFSSTGTFTNSAANTISASGDVVISGSFGGTSTDNTLTMSGDGTSLDTSENLGNLSVDPGSGNIVSLANNALVLDGDLAINSGSLKVAGLGLTVSGSFSNSDTLGFAGGESTVSLPSSPIPGTVHYYGNSSTTGLVGGNSYTDLLFENSIDTNSVTWTLSADLSVSDMLTVGSSTTLSTGGNNVTASGDLDVSSGTLDAGGSGTITIGGDVSFGTLTGGSGSTLELDGSSAQAIVPNGQSFGAVNLSGSGGVTLSGTGSFQSLTIAGGESLTLGGGAVTTGLTVNGTVTNGGSLYLNSDDAGGPTSLSMADGTTIANSGVLQVASSTGAVELSSPGTTTLTGNELDVNGKSLNLGGFETAVDHTLGAGDTVTLVGDATFSGTLTLNGTGASLTTGNNTLSTGTLTLTEGTVVVSGSGDVDAGSGAVTVGASGVMTFNTTGSPALISGDFTSSGTVNNSQTTLVRASGDVEIDGSFGTPANSTIEMSGASATINTVVQ
ncbi:beta strand repeat-containing protein, partial [Sediminispirochaeta bajacaliforniensis]|uniref:beta strand repeat-containing protein n=1 Tax=Sediminispirochaeta bajacaliforniensis TaxID=148 RepID=UPI0003804840